MPFSLYNHPRLIAYLYHQAVQPSGSTAPRALLRGKTIKKIKMDLSESIETIIESKPLLRTQAFINIWGTYVYKCKPRQILNDDNEFVNIPAMIEEDELLSSIDNYYSPMNGFSIVLSYLFVEYLRNHGPRRIRKCPYCNKYFLAKHARRERCYSKECEKKYQRLKKRKQRELEPEIYS